MTPHLLRTSALFGLVTGVVVAVSGCGDNPLDAVCCNEFKVGATIDADIGGSAQSRVAVQAVADVAAIASAAIDDITAGCRTIAEDLDATTDEKAAAEQTPDRRDRMNAWCTLAATAIGNLKVAAGGGITITVAPPTCEASFSAKASCQASCSASGKCDVNAKPPTCSGGKLVVSCKGECKAEAGASVSCEGTCTGACDGSCTASGGVQCNGKCEGTCRGEAEGGTGEGIRADGTCAGTCEGTCAVTAPGVTCNGSCKGKCDASCKGSAEASVQCDGTCEGTAEPLRCEGGTLSGGCEVDASCDANCDASVSAKAQCTPPSIVVDISGAADADLAAKLKATLETNLGVIVAFKTRLDAMATAVGTLSTNVTAVTDIKAICLLPLGEAIVTAVGDIAASVQASGSIVAQVQ